MYNFSVDYRVFDTSNIIDIQKYLMKKHDVKCLELLKKCLLYYSLASIVNISNYTKCASFRNQKCKIQSTLINLHPNECNQESHYYPFAVK